MTLHDTNAETTAPGQHDHAGPATASPADVPVPSDLGTERGHTTIAEHAVEHIATRLIAESEHMGGTARRVFGVTLGAEHHGRDAQVHARVHGETATSLTVRCSIPYPTPVRQATDAVRTHLMRRVEELTGLTVQHVDITVTALTTEAGVRVQ